MYIFAALFEVMDKEPSLLQIWTLFITLGIGGFLLCRYGGWHFAIIIPAVIFFAFGHLMELNDPFVGPAIAREAGQSYVIQSYIAIAIGIILPCLGLAAGKKKLP